MNPDLRKVAEKYLPAKAFGYDGKLHLERLTGNDWRKFHMDRAKHLGTHTRAEWEELRDRIGECVKCGWSENLTKDHIVPVSRGGCDCIQNIQPLCRNCNSSKGVR